MEYTNDERIKIFESLYSIFKSHNIIKVDLPDDFVDGLAKIREEKLAIIEPISDKDYIMPYWVKRKNNILFVFPTPPYDKKMSSTLEDTLVKFINDTRKCLTEIAEIRPKPKKLILDLRSNVGGYIHVFYDALYPILPKHVGIVLSGVDLLGNEIMQLSEDNKELNLIIKDPYNGTIKINNKLTEPKKLKIPKIEVWVNSRTASSAEMIMIMYKQTGHKIVGGPTMGLTSGMLTQSYNIFSVSVPYYWFKDKKGTIYNATIRPKPSAKPQLLEANVVAEIPQNVLKRPVDCALINHIHCKYLGENGHFGITYMVDNPKPTIQVNDNNVYIHIPENCLTHIDTLLNPLKDDILSGKLVIIDIRNTKLKDLDSLKIFSSLYKPFTLPLVDTTNDTGNDNREFYISSLYPYVTTKKQMVAGKYSNINAKFWVNKNSIYGDTKSLVLLKYLIWSFGLVEGSTSHYFFDYSLYKHTKPPYAIEIYSCQYKL